MQYERRLMTIIRCTVGWLITTDTTQTHSRETYTATDGLRDREDRERERDRESARCAHDWCRQLTTIITGFPPIIADASQSCSLLCCYEFDNWRRRLSAFINSAQSRHTSLNLSTLTTVRCQSAHCIHSCETQCKNMWMADWLVNNCTGHQQATQLHSLSALFGNSNPSQPNNKCQLISAEKILFLSFLHSRWTIKITEEWVNENHRVIRATDWPKDKNNC